jgi:hypothetical protein
MFPFNIDHTAGTVSLPNGNAISPSLSQDAFRQSAMFPKARAQDFGTLPWIHYHFSGGAIEGHELFTSLCFYDQMLVYASLSANLYTPGVFDWSNYSLDVEAATKELHDRLLNQLLGKPTRSTRLSVGQLLPEQATLARPLTWQFPWGQVGSGHDFKGGGTCITISYGNRREEACRLYESKRR